MPLSWPEVRIPYLLDGPPLSADVYKELSAFEDAVFRIIRRAKRPGQAGFLMYDLPQQDIDGYVHAVMRLFGDLDASRIRELRIARLRLIPLFNAIVRVIRNREL